MDIPTTTEVASGYTNKRWAALIGNVEENLRDSQVAQVIPQVDGPAFAKTIDHTLLKLDAQAAQIDDLCAEAKRDKFATVCVRPNFVQKSVENLRGTDVQVASVIGFHEGTYTLDHKLQESQQSLQSGATELDIVLNRTVLQSREYATVFNELATLRHHAPKPTLLKLILETAHLSNAEIVAACTLAAAADFDFVKTSTGFDGRGATEEVVRLMFACCETLTVQTASRPKMRVKASGGIRTLANAVAMLHAGASRLGASSGVQIVQQGRENAEQSEREISSKPGSTPAISDEY
nr:deoxyribose-phosphate aldolase [Quercus suber]